MQFYFTRLVGDIIPRKSKYLPQNYMLHFQNKLIAFSGQRYSRNVAMLLHLRLTNLTFILTHPLL